jgi:hypothetical protein
MKKELNSKKNQRTEPVTYLGRQVKSSAELVKMMKMKRENGIDAAHIIAEVQGSILNQNMPSRNVGGTKASKSQLVGVQGTNTKPTKQCRNIGGTKATMAEGPNKSSLNMSSLNVAESKITTVEGPNKKPTKRISPSFSLASHSLEKKSKLSTSNESRTKVSNEANSHVMKKGVAAATNESQLEHQRNKQPMKSATSHNESLEKQQGPKKTPKMPGLRAMLIDNFLKENGVQVEEDEELDIEGEEEEDDIEREGEIAPEEEGSVVNGKIGYSLSYISMSL